MSEENKEEFSVITDAEMDAQKKKSEEVDKLLTPPEGQVLDGLRSFCPIHGEITYGASGNGNVPCVSTGFCVAITRKGSSALYVVPSTVI